MRWKPAHDAHAIERVSVTIDLSEPIPLKAWRIISDNAELVFSPEGFSKAAGIFPGQVVLSGGAQIAPVGQFFFGGFDPRMAAEAAAAPPLVFQKAEGADVHEECYLFRERFLYAATRYDRWSRFQGRFSSLFTPALDHALQIVSASSVKVEYWDRFNFDGPSAEANYSELLNAGSDYLPDFSFAGSEMWHSHNGFFRNNDGQKCLINVNVDVIDVFEAQVALPTTTPTPKRSVGIYSMAQDKSENHPQTATECISTMEGFHTILKGVLDNMLTPEAAARIRLNA
jgi:hypothetical protein